jgi:hypothetical protein
MGRAARVYQELGGVAGEIAPLGTTPNLGAIGKLLERFSNSAMAGRHGAAERTAPEQ